jgi:hypothetical protein
VVLQTLMAQDNSKVGWHSKVVASGIMVVALYQLVCQAMSSTLRALGLREVARLGASCLVVANQTFQHLTRHQELFK